jgi:hypothetical protein
MSRKRSKKKRLQQHRFAIKLMRPIFQTTVIVVAAATEAHAVRIALRAAARLKDSEWAGGFEPRRYQYDVQHVIDVDEWGQEAAGEGRSETDAELSAFLRSFENVRYLLLKADIEVGQGGVLNEPWLDDKSHLFLADVAGDWLADIETLEEEGLEGYLRRGRRSNVIPFRGPLTGDDHDPD